MDLWKTRGVFRKIEEGKKKKKKERRNRAPLGI